MIGCCFSCCDNPCISRETKAGQVVLLHHRCSYVLNDGKGLCGGDHTAKSHMVADTEGLAAKLHS